mmetsp:Transcript_84488/g.219994  ORF Transcript_84488/g.219994 Transcript_84488/m.219994 type:complete len:202 (+) Transcript_84488:1262-1867(+)
MEALKEAASAFNKFRFSMTAASNASDNLRNWVCTTSKSCITRSNVRSVVLLKPDCMSFLCSRLSTRSQTSLSCKESLESSRERRSAESSSRCLKSRIRLLRSEVSWISAAISCNWLPCNFSIAKSSSMSDLQFAILCTLGRTISMTISRSLDSISAIRTSSSIFDVSGMPSKLPRPRRVLVGERTMATVHSCTHRRLTPRP